MRKTKGDIELMQEEIIDTAIRIFSSKGYSATNVQDIADALNTTRTPVYYHFKNKQTLYKQAVITYLQRKKDTYQNIMEKDDYIFIKIKKHLLFGISYGVSEANFFNELKNEEFHELAERNQQTAEKIYASKQQAIQEAIEKGNIRSDMDIEELIDYIYVLSYGLMRMTREPLHKRSNADLETLIDVFISTMEQRYGTIGK